MCVCHRVAAAPLDEARAAVDKSGTTEGPFLAALQPVNKGLVRTKANLQLIDLELGRWVHAVLSNACMCASLRPKQSACTFAGAGEREPWLGHLAALLVDDYRTWKPVGRSQDGGCVQCPAGRKLRRC